MKSRGLCRYSLDSVCSRHFIDFNRQKVCNNRVDLLEYIFLLSNRRRFLNVPSVLWCLRYVMLSIQIWQNKSLIRGAFLFSTQGGRIQILQVKILIVILFSRKNGKPVIICPTFIKYSDMTVSSCKNVDFGRPFRHFIKGL